MRSNSQRTLHRVSYLALAFLLGLAQPAFAQHVWIEAESLAKKPEGFKTGGWGNQHYLSGDSWLFASIEGQAAEALPADGLLLEFPFAIKSQGPHEVWARVGYEFVRSPLQWRIDSQAWGEDGPDRLTTDLMSLQDWNEVAWVKLGTAELAQGKHGLQIKFPRKVLPGKKEPERILTGLDCFCISKEPFRPNGRWQPGQDYRDDTDREASRQVFQAAPGAAARTALPLKGNWEICRFDEQEVKDRDQPIAELPADLGTLFWKSATVPSRGESPRADMLNCHRYLYRTRIHIPSETAKHSYVLRFPSTALIASVFVNGKYCGGNSTPCAAWEADISQAVAPGKPNEVVVAIKDLYYAIEKTGDNKPVRMMFNYPVSWFVSGGGGGGGTRNADFPVLLQVQGSGILETPTLTITGSVYANDVFAKSSVSRKELGLEITLHNSSAQPVQVEIQNTVEPVTGGAVEKTFNALTVTVPAGGEQVVHVNEPWANPKLWWPDEPNLYQVVTRLAIAGKMIDEKRTKFGFREWQWKGQHFTLNGIPWHFRADTSMGGKIADADKVNVIDYWKKSGINTVRYWGQRPLVGESQEETLDFFDSVGMPVRRSGIFDGEAASYNLVETKDGKTVPRKPLFDNWIRQVKAQIKAERNHPSVFVWSIENEITYINIRNFGLHDPCEPEIRRAVKEVMQMDPTRPAMIDGGDALRDQSLPVYGNHYNEANFREYPDEAYTMKLAFNRHKKDSWTPWPIGDDKPLFLGESFFANGFPPAAYAALIGEEAFLGRNQAEPGVHLFARMLAEGYRWHGLAGFHFWFDANNPASEHYKAFQPVCVFCKESDSTFGSGETVPRTLKVFNDTRFSDPIKMTWSFRVQGQVLAQGTETFSLEPGTAKEHTIAFKTPAVLERTRGELELICRRSGQEVYRDRKPCVILPELPVLTSTAGKPQEQDIAVFDPRGVVQPWLKKRGYSFQHIDSLDRLSSGRLNSKCKVLIVGPDALTALQSTEPFWLALAASGVRILVLDQTHPLHYQALPADLTPTGHAGRIAFPENLDHPAFRGLGKEDFFCWSRDHVVYRNAYKKASRGSRSLLQCDDELSCSALAECPVQDGMLVLAQTAIGSKLNFDPVAARLLDNLIVYCLNYRRPAKNTVTVFSEKDLRLKLIEASGLKHTRANNLLEAIADSKAEIVIADASAANLAQLAAAKDKLREFTKQGHHLMLWGLTPAGLNDFNKIVDVHHAIRPFTMERVSLPGKRDPLLAGLTTRDVVLESTEQIFPWSADRYPGKDGFTHIVDLDDIAPFVRPLNHGHGWGQMTNGLTSADSWKFIFYHELKNDPHPKWSAEFPKEEEVIRFSIILNTHYQVISKLRLIFDDNEADAVTLDLKGTAELKQEFDLKPRRCKRITLEPIAFDTRGKQPTTGVDNIWITVRRSDDEQKRVAPLLNIGGLVKYRMDQGSVILNQLRVLENEPNPVNGPKKQNIVATLLRNLGATFAAERLIIAGANMQYAPIALNEKCNQFLTSDRGWIPGQPDLARFPIGEQKLAGVTYLIRDFKTSPLPTCIMLASPGANGSMPKSVEGIPLKRKADALFFLHAFHVNRPWRAQGEKDQPPAVFSYLIHYADGKTAEMPVRLSQEVGHWISEEPQGLPAATVAWTAALPKEANRHAVVYQASWTNPRPEVEIRSIDVRANDTPGGSHGIPIVLGITAATATK